MKYFSCKSRLRVFVIAVISSILFLRIAPFLLQNIIFPLGLLETIIYCMVPILVVAFVFGIINALRVGRKVRGRKIEGDVFENIAWAPACAIILGFTMLMFCDLMKSSARIEVKRFFGKIPATVSVTINGNPIENSKQIIDALKKVAPLPAHRSHTINKINIEIFNQAENLPIVLERDSAYPQEYWVFFPKYRYTSKNEIGRIITNVFDDY